MNTELLSKIESKHLAKRVPDFRVGDTVEVNTIIREGEKQRFQKFKGLVMEVRGSGARRTFTVRKISYGIGVEKTFPVNSTNIESITLLKRGKVKQSNIFYMRQRIGKLAMKVTSGGAVPVMVFSEGEDQSDVEDVADLGAEAPVEETEPLIGSEEVQTEETQTEATEDSAQTEETPAEAEGNA